MLCLSPVRFLLCHKTIVHKKYKHVQRVTVSVPEYALANVVEYIILNQVSVPLSTPEKKIPCSLPC